MDRKYRRSFSWLAVVLCMALLMTGMPLAPAYAKSKKDTYYTIKWKVNGETVKKDKVKKGEKPEKPEDPADYDDGKYTYTFKGWEPKVTKATKDMTYKAQFKKTERTFTITWLDDEGKLIDFTKVKYGKVPTHEDPKKKPSKKSTYTFAGWDPKPVKAKEDTTYTATFEKKARTYTITWLDDKGNEIDQTKVAYGKLPTHDDPVKASEKYTYTFTGWQPALTEVTEDATYTATFEKGEKIDGKYTITWLDDAGNLIDTTEVKAGKLPKHDDPAKAPTEQYTYTFTGWTPEVVKAEGDATYTATFEQAARVYTVTWLDDEGNVIDQTGVPYGETPTHADPTLSDSESYTYVFKGWEPALAPVTGDATYTAVFDEIPKDPAAPEQTVEPEQAPETFTIYWLDGENVIDTTTAQAGEVPFHEPLTREATEEYTYTFTGWTPEPEAATGDAAYTATFSQAPRTYAVTWLDDADNVIDTTLVAYGEMPVHDDPAKAATEQATYTFAGWTPELAPVTGEATYKATFTETLNPETEDPAMAVGDTVNITFLNWDGTPLGDPNPYIVTEPATQVYYAGAEPTRADESVTYRWIGWTDGTNHYGKSRNGEEAPLLPAATADATYTAEYDAYAAITIKWNYDGATDTVLEGRVGEAVTAPASPREGYTLGGWQLADGTVIPVEAFPTTFTTNMTLTAVWKVKVTVDWDYQDSTATVLEGLPGEAVTAPASPREGYTLGGWRLPGSDSVSPKFIETFPNADATVKAVWNVTITYDWNYKVGKGIKKVNKLTGLSGEKVEEPEQQRGDDYIVIGWTRPGSTEQEAFPQVFPNEDITLTAQWAKGMDLGKVECPAYVQSAKALRKATALMPKEVTLDDGTTAKLNWKAKDVVVLYKDAGTDVEGDGTYTFILSIDNSDSEYVVICDLVVGPKKSKTVGADKKKNTKYRYRWDAPSEDANAIIVECREADAKKDGTPKALTIPAIIDGKTVVGIGEGVFQGKEFKTIVVPDGVTSIGDSAFADCPNLNKLTLPDSLTEIGAGIISGDTIESVTLSISLKTTMAVEGGSYTICHEVEEAKSNADPTMTTPVALPENTPTDLTINDGGVLTLGMSDSFTILEGHKAKGVSATTVINDPGVLLAEICWQDDAGTYLDSTFVEYGTVPTHDPLTREGYTFIGWNPTPVAVTNPATYQAVFSTGNQFIVTFTSEDGNTTYEKKPVDAGTQPRYTGTTPTKEGDASKVYTFDGWVDAADTSAEPTVYTDKTFPPVTADTTYKAHFSEEAREAIALKVTYTGPTLTKVYDLTRNVFKTTASGGTTYAITAPKEGDFTLAPAKDSDKEFFNSHKKVQVNVASIKSVEQFSGSDAGQYNLKFTFGLKGDDAQYYTANAVTVKAEITKREVVITPRAGTYKVYGTTDPTYKEGSWLSSDETSPLHQSIAGVPSYGVPLNTVDGTTTLTVEDRTADDITRGIKRGSYLTAEARKNNTKFFPNDGWLDRAQGEDAGTYKIGIGKMNFGKNFNMTLKDDVFTITAKNIGEANVTVDAVGNQKYTGRAIEPELTVRYGTMTLKKDTDYTVEFTDNVEPSTDAKKATATLTGKGNFTGTKEVTFTIIRTADTTATPSPTSTPSSGGGSSSSGYGYDGFDDEDEDDEEAEDEDEGVGVLTLDEVEYGTVLFGNDGLPRPFEIYDEEIEVPAPVEEGIVEAQAEAMDEAPGEADVEIDDESETPETVRRVTIIPEPMKIPSFEEDGEDEDVLIEGTNRQRYEELHLRLTTTEVQALVNNSVTEIVYELENAQLVLPLASLTSEIALPEEEEPEDDDDAEVDEELEIEDGIEVDNSMAFGVSMDQLNIIDEEDEETATSIVVEGYDIVIEQADAEGLTPGEQALIADNVTLTNAYRVRVHIIPEGAEQVPTGETDDYDEPITAPATEPLPEGCTLPDVVLRVSTNDSYLMAPEGTNVLYASPAASEAVPEEAADTPDESGETPEGETPVAQTPVDPLMTGDATLTPAVYDEEEDPIRVVITPVTDGMYIAVAPPDWDPTPYLEDAGEADDFEAFEDTVEGDTDDEELEFEDDEEI